jgi:outer membrane protein TolC
MKRPPITRLALPVICCLLVAACASYHSLPLPQTPALAPDLAALKHDGVAIVEPLTVDSLVRLALENIPDLRATRAQIAVAQAQSLQASLPPNPQVTGAALPLAAGSGSTFAWNSGLSENITQLITLGARRARAQAAERQVDA